MTRRDIDPAARTRGQKIAMAVFCVSVMMLIASVDAFAFMVGAYATISQLWLAMNRRAWFMTYVLAAGMGALLWHVSLPRDPGRIPEPSFWRHALTWTAFFWLGMWVGRAFLWQLPERD